MWRTIPGVVAVLAAAGGVWSLVAWGGLALAVRGRNTAVLWLLALGPVVPVATYEYAGRVDALTAKRARGLEAPDRLAIWSLNLAMAAGGAPLAPEAAVETALLAVPGPRERHFRSAFAMRDPGVRAAVADLARRGAGPLPSRRVTWPMSGRGRSIRVGLACNPLVISGRAVPVADRVRLDLQGRVDVRYPQRARLHLFTLADRRVGIEEGLYADLQDAGWLFPYTAVWHWSVWADEVR